MVMLTSISKLGNLCFMYSFYNKQSKFCYEFLAIGQTKRHQFTYASSGKNNEAAYL